MNRKTTVPAEKFCAEQPIKPAPKMPIFFLKKLDLESVAKRYTVKESLKNIKRWKTFYGASNPVQLYSLLLSDSKVHGMFFSDFEFGCIHRIRF